MKFRVGGVVVGLLSLVLSLVQLTVAQTPTETASALPHLVRFGGTVKDLNGNPVSGIVGITFALYSEQSGGSALWLETQNVTADSNGHYTVLLGSTTSEGMPAGLFTSEQAHWVGAQVSGQAEQPRVLLVSAPYALKAGDAETVGGYPASSFVMANASGGHSAGGKRKTAPGTETQNFIPIFIDNSGDLGNSILFQSGTTEVGINTTTPSATLEVNGTAKFDNLVNFASGQSFPGTLTGITAGTGITVTGSKTNPTVGINVTFADQSYAQLKAPNTFTANQTVNGTLTATTSSPFGLIGTTSSTQTFAAGVEGGATATTGATIGVYGSTQSSAGFGLYGEAFSLTGTTYGVYAQTESPAGYGVYGFVDSTSGTTAGVWGNTSSTTGYGVYGLAQEPTGTATGVFGQTKSNQGYGVEGASSYIGVYGTGSTGIVGTSSSAPGTGVQGSATSTSGNNFGVFGINYSPTGYGVYGENFVTSGTTAGVYGTTASTQGYGVEGVAGGVGGIAGFFQVLNGSASILQGNNGANTEFKVDAAGDVVATGAVSGSSFEIGGQLFDYGSYGVGNAFLGFAGSPNTNGTAKQDVAVGYAALSRDTLGYNAAVGEDALTLNTTGINNTAIGFYAGYTNDGSNLTGNTNTALGANTTFSTGTLSNATAVGANAIVSESNALILGYLANVGIGTSAPGHLLDVAGAVAFDSTGLNNGNGIDLTFGIDAGEGVSSSRTSGPNQYGLDLYTDYNRRISIEQHGNVGIGTTSPDNLLSVNGSADKPGGGSWGTFSDARLKTVNGGFTSGLSQVMKINPIHYRYRPDNAMGIRDTDEHIGVVAQDVQKVIPEAVTKNSKGYLLVNNDPIIWTMLNAIKEQQGEFQQEKTELANALRLVKQQQNLLRAQSAAMRSLKAEVRETRESLRKVKAQMSAPHPALVAMK
jgi:Chaperone of endosialidase